MKVNRSHWDAMDACQCLSILSWPDAKCTTIKSKSVTIHYDSPAWKIMEISKVGMAKMAVYGPFLINWKDSPAANEYGSVEIHGDCFQLKLTICFPSSLSFRVILGFQVFSSQSHLMHLEHMAMSIETMKDVAVSCLKVGHVPFFIFWKACYRINLSE